MTQEEKQLLLKDLHGRIQYGVKIATSLYQYGDVLTIKGIVGEKCYFNDNPRYDGDCHVEKVKPYLRPMSSMTEEEKDELYTAMDWYGEIDESGNVYTKGQEKVYRETFYEYSDWLNKNMFDYRGLIPIGLALEAKEGMYENE